MPEQELTDFSSLINMDYPETPVVTDIEETGTQEQSTQEQTQEPQITLEDRVGQIADQLSQYGASNEKIMTVLTALVQRVMNPPQVNQRTEIEDSALQELGFSDPERGRKFLNTLEQNITSRLDQQIQPVVQSNQLNEAARQIQMEFDATRNRYPDFDMWIQPMTLVSREIKGLRPEELYLKTKALYPGYKPKPVAQQQQQSNNTAQGQNVRKFPPRIQSTNTSTDGGERKIESIDDALNATYEELGINVG